MTRLLFIRIACLAAIMFAYSATVFAQESSPKLKAAVETLQKKGIIQESDAAYWLENARKGKSCDGEKVGILIVKSVSIKKKVKTLTEACDYLQATKTLDKTSFWRTFAVKGKSCEGGGTAILLIRLAKLVG